MMPTTDEALAYLGYDYADEVVTANVSRALKAAEGYFYGTIGEAKDVEAYLSGDPRVPELVLHYLDDFYEDKGVTSSKANSATRRLIASTEQQLRLELRRKKEEAEASGL